MRNLEFLKSFYVVAVFLIVSVTAFAQQKVSTIAEIKALNDGTQIEFNGDAMTTYHQGELSGIAYGYYGILVQDATGAILLKDGAFKANGTMYNDAKRPGYRVHFGGTKVSKIIGTFKKATSSLPDRIEFTSSELKKIVTGTYDNEIVYNEVDLADFLASPANYELMSMAISVTDVVKDGTRMYFKLGDQQIELKPYFTLINSSFPIGGTYYGFCEKYKDNYRFAVESSKYIQPTSFANAVELYNFTDDSNRSVVAQCEVEIVEPVLVNYIEEEGSKINYYVQSSYVSLYSQQVRGFVLSVDKNSNLGVNVGDSIVGLKGYYNKYILDNGIHKPTTFVVSNDNLSKIRVLNSGNSNDVKETQITTILGAPSEYEAQILSLPRGTIKNSNGEYYFSTYSSLREQYDSIAIVMGDATNLSLLLGKEVVICGLFKVFADQPKLVIRSAKDILVDNLVFESIGDMIEAGKPLSTSIVYEISNPVLVTYKYFKANTEGDQNNNMCALYLQDKTGSILYKTSVAVEGVNPGDSIVGIKGTFIYEDNVPGRQAHYLKADAKTPLTVLNSNNNFEPTPISIGDIIDDPMQYSSHLIKIENAERMVKFGMSQGLPYETTLVYQNGKTLVVDWDDMYDDMDIVGVVEYGVMGLGLTILPIQITDKTAKFDGTCRRISDIKKLSDGTDFVYVGNATTTFTDYENGILIEDYTGGILLRNAKLGENGTSKIKFGTTITNIKGKYSSSSSDVMTSIIIEDVDIDDIIEVDNSNLFVCRSTDINEINAFYDKYLEGNALLINDPGIQQKNDGGYVITFASYSGGSDKPTIVELPAILKGDIDLTSNKIVGYARKFGGVLTFVIVGNDVPEQPVDVEFVENSNIVYLVDNTIMAQNAATIEVYDINGRVVASSNSDQINISVLNKGIYIIRSVYADGTYQITKVIK